MGMVLVLTLWAAIDPVRLGIAALLTSRPRPMHNLLAYWFGTMAIGLTAITGLLILLHDFSPTFMQTVSAALASCTARHVKIAIGLFVLPVAALIAVDFSARWARVPTAGGDPSAQVSPSRPTPFGRVQDLLEGGSLWVAFVVGLGHGPPVEAYPVILAVIAASGDAIGTQVSATIIFMVGMLAVVEIPLVCSLAAPARTQTVMLQLHDWMRTRRRRILAAMLAFIGVMLVTTGVGSA
ncbi:MAG TPA: GAP family protein [Mycobacterium sp.]|nr:GAP family protein [Mycobacterium sp.]